MTRDIKFVIIHTHPIQYNSPFFAKLAKKVNLKVFFTWKNTLQGYHDKKFGKKINWDIPLTQGYAHEFIKNISPWPAPNTLIGTINPGKIKKIKAYNPDAILIYGWKNLSHLATMMYFKGKVPVLFRGDSTMLDNPGNKLRTAVLSKIYRYIDFALYVGTENKKYYKSLGLKEEQLIFVPHAVDNQRFSSNHAEKEKEALLWKKHLGISPDNLVFLYAGKFEPKKNLEFLIRTFKDIQLSNLRLILVGNGMLEEKLKHLASGDKRIIFLPFQNQSRMPIVYRLADVFILPSAWGETWGLSVNEAMASGRAIIASNKAGCATDLVKPDVNGYIFRYNSPNDLTAKILKFNKVLAKKFGHNSQEIIQKWSYDEGINNLLNLLKTIKQ